MSEERETFQRLGEDCGHHCGFKEGIERHCSCRDCHALRRVADWRAVR